MPNFITANLKRCISTFFVANLKNDFKLNIILLIKFEQKQKNDIIKLTNLKN